jgi:general secretion pathway protein G
MRSRNQCGFTLIELLVVFALIALLLTIAVPRYLNATETAKERARSQNMATLRDALDKFKADQGRYPNALAEVVQKQYLRHVPMDPVSQSDRWVTVPVPGGVEPGIYDVAPPDAGVQGAPEPSAGGASAGSRDNDAGTAK